MTKKPTGPHYPLPWRINSPKGLFVPRHEIMSADNHEVCHCLSQKNAGFIVRAVNAHEELLEAAKEMFGHLRLTGNVKQPEWITRWMQAIAKAEGKQ